MQLENLLEGRWEHKNIGFMVRVVFASAHDVTYRRLASGFEVTVAREVFDTTFMRSDGTSIGKFQTWLGKHDQRVYFIRARDAVAGYLLVGRGIDPVSVTVEKLVELGELAESNGRPIPGNIWRIKRWRGPQSEARLVLVTNVDEHDVSYEGHGHRGADLFSSRLEMGDFMRDYEVVARCEIEGPYGHGYRASVQRPQAIPGSARPLTVPLTGTNEYFLTEKTPECSVTCGCGKEYSKLRWKCPACGTVLCPWLATGVQGPDVAKRQQEILDREAATLPAPQLAAGAAGEYFLAGGGAVGSIAYEESACSPRPALGTGAYARREPTDSYDRFVLVHEVTDDRVTYTCIAGVKYRAPRDAFERDFESTATELYEMARASYQVALGFRSVADAMTTKTGENICRKEWSRELVARCPKDLDPRGWTAVVLWSNESGPPDGTRTLRQPFRHGSYTSRLLADVAARRLARQLRDREPGNIHVQVYEAALRQPQPVAGPWRYRRRR